MTRHLTILALSLGTVAAQNAATAPASPVRWWLTTGDEQALLAPQAEAHFTRDGAGSAPFIAVDDSQRYQTMVGVGAALTDASAWLIGTQLSAAARQTLLADLFSPQGAGLDMLRLPMGASDFARSHYSYDDLPAGQTDPTLAQFSVQHDQAYIIPVAKSALAVNQNLRFMASPWSAPGWMKTTGSLVKGSLKPEYHQAYARYFVKFVQAYRAAGVPISYLTVQNEPHYEPASYPGMRMEAEQEAAFVGTALGPALRRAAPQVKLLAWDHNWDEPDYALNVLADRKAASFLDGSAFHCYGGDVSAQSQVHDVQPKGALYFTECSGTSSANKFADNLRWNMKNLVIGAPRNWARSVLLWNLALDPQGNPHTGGCGDCRGVVTVGPNDQITKNVEYYALAHYGRAVRPGAIRIASNLYGADVAALPSVAFKNPDGSLALIVLNDEQVALNFKVKARGASFWATLPAGAVATYLWTGAGSDAPPGPPPPQDAYGRVEAENYSAIQGVQTESTQDEGGGRDVGYTDDGDTLTYQNVDFGTGGAKNLNLRVAAGGSGGDVEVLVGDQLVAKAHIDPTGGWQTWKTLTVPIQGVLKGQQTVILTFRNGSGIGNVNWFSFAR